MLKFTPSAVMNSVEGSGTVRSVCRAGRLVGMYMPATMTIGFEAGLPSSSAARTPKCPFATANTASAPRSFSGSKPSETSDQVASLLLSARVKRQLP